MLRHELPVSLRCGPFSTSAGVAAVGRGALYGPGYRRVRRGVHVAATEPRTHLTLIRSIRESAGDLPVLLGPSAAYALGCELAGDEDPVHVAMGRTRGGRADATVVAHRHDVAADDVVLTRWGPATSPRRTAVDLARGVGTHELGEHARVAWLDALLRVTGLAAADLLDDVRRRSRMPGLPVARRVITRARDGVDSVKETELRLLVVDRGFVEPSVQAPVRTMQGRIVALLDLGWEEQRLGLEYDGAVHRESRQHSKDLRRHNRIRGRGWTVLQVDRSGLAEPDEWLGQLAELGAPRHA
ncbi:MAG: hypothetical protein ACFCVG_02525 [Kineosporiaceae bacterium]